MSSCRPRSNRTRPTVAAAAALGVALLGGCGDGSEGAAPVSGGDVIVATTTVLGSVAADIAECAGGSVRTLMPIGADPHDFSPSSAEVATMVSAPLVVANGLGLEAGLQDALAGAANDGASVLEVAPMLDPIPFAAEDQDEQHDEDEQHGSEDPHVWLDAGRMALAAELVGDELAAVTGEQAYADCGREVRAELTSVDHQVRDILAVVPAERRVLVTDHDAFGYFAEAYDFRIAGVVVPGGSTLAEPSSAELADLVSVVEREDVPALFSNTAAGDALVDAVATEAGPDIEVVDLYVGSLGPDGSGAETYAGMVLTNAERVATALG